MGKGLKNTCTRTILAMSGLMIFIGCTSAEKPNSNIKIDEPQKVSFEVKKGPFVEFEDPLPAYQPIFVEWQYQDKTSKSVLSYKGWDFDNDRQIDMLEILEMDGSRQAMAFDFNGDGRIDLIRRKTADTTDLKTAQNMPMPPDNIKFVH